MTITNQIVEITYPGNGVTTSWAFNFLIPTVDSVPAVNVWTIDPAGSRTLLTPNLYTVFGADNPVGGLINYAPALATGWQIVIQRAVPPKQEQSFENQSFYPEDIEAGLDYATMVLQQLQETVGRTIRGAPGEAFNWLPPASFRAGKALQFDNAGNPIVVTPSGGGGGGSQDWNNLINVPANISAFAGLGGSADQVAYFTDAGTLTLSSFTAQGRNVVGQSSYAAMLRLMSPLSAKGDLLGFNGTTEVRVPIGTDGQVLQADSTAATGFSWQTLGGGGTTWASVTGKPANITAFAALASAADQLPYFTGSGTMAMVTATAFSRGLFAQTDAAGWKAALGVSGTGTPPFNPLTTYGAVENGVTDDTTAIATWLADSTQHRVWLEGVSVYTSANYLINKRMMGPGRITNTATGDKLPADFCWLLNKPAVGTGTDANYFFSGDLSHIDAQYFILGSLTSNPRLGVTEPYFESVTTPKFTFFTNYAGASGAVAHLAANIVAGATTCQVNTTASITNGQTIGFFDPATGAIRESRAVTVVDGTHLSWTGGLTFGYNQYAAITNGFRTMNQFNYLEVTHNGLGDAYSYESRGIIGSVAPAGAVHFFEVGTIGGIGGDMTHVTDHTFSTPHEWNTVDQGHDVAHMSFISSFQRTNDTGAWSEVWLGLNLKSEGTKPIDAFIFFAGQSRSGIDMSLADFTSNGNAAMQFKLSQRMYWGVTCVAGGRGYKQNLYGYGGLWGNTLSDMWITFDNDGATDFFQVKLGTTFMSVKRSGALLSNCEFIISNSAIFSGDVSTNTTMYATAMVIQLGGIGPSGKPALGFIAGNNNWIAWNNSTHNFEFIKAGVVVSTI